MAKEFAKAFYLSKAWRKCREAYFISQHGLCEECGGPGKIVHHIIELTSVNINNHEIALGWDNLQLLCQDCHNKEHHGSPVTEKGLRFDEDGNIIPISPRV